MTRNGPEIIEVTSQRIDELLERATSHTLRDDDLELMRQILTSYQGLFEMVGDKNTTIARLRKMMFGATSETAKNILGDAAGGGKDDAPKTPPGDKSDHPSDSDESRDDTEPKDLPRGHGRYAAED